MVMKSRWYVGVVELFERGKKRPFGATSRRVNAKNKQEAINKLKRMFKFKNVIVKVTKLR